MKKLFTYTFTMLSLLISTCSSQNVEPILNSQSQKVVLEYVDFSRIDKAVKKYAHLQSQAEWIKRLKYFAIGAGCTGLGLLIFKHYFSTQDKPNDSQNLSAAKNVPQKPDRDSVNELIRDELLKRASWNGRFREASLSALDIVIFTAVSTSVWAIINKSGELLKNQFIGIDLDSNFYKQKNAKLNNLIKQLGIFLMQHEQDSKGEHASKFFDLMFADILINHTTLIRWFEDLIGFIKCMVISATGRDSLEVACLEKDILSLSASLNQFTDKISCIFNSCTDIQEHSMLVDQATTSYLVFCKQFSKFIYDCGLYLYEEDFLQENSLQNNA
ncbi:MAG: hypothetical protein V1646_01285 [bacterium]